MSTIRVNLSNTNCTIFFTEQSVQYIGMKGETSMQYYLEPRCKEILELLLQSPTYLSIPEIMKDKKISRRSVYYDINKINDWLKSIQVDTIEFERNKGVLISDSQRTRIQSHLREQGTQQQFVYSPMERVKIIICTTILDEKPLSIDDFINITQVSRNTVINDLKLVNKQFNDHQLEFYYEPKKGYLVKGEELKKRTVFFLYFNEIADFYIKNYIPIKQINKVDDYLVKLYKIEKELKMDYVGGICLSIALYFASIHKLTPCIEFSECEQSEIIPTKEYILIDEHFPNLARNEKIYMALHLLGARLQSIPFEELNKEDDIYEITRSFIQEFSRISSIEFTLIDELETALFQHLKTSIYRYRYGIQLGNPMLKDIKREYRELFAITSKACEYLEQRLNLIIPESEIAYITLHFGGFIKNQKQNQKRLSVLIICPNGVSAANMLRHEVESLLPNTSQIDMVSVSDYDLNHTYDIVISTIMFNDENHEILTVHPILTDNDRLLILRKCNQIQHNTHANAVDVLEIIKPYVEEEQFIEVNKKVKRYFADLQIGASIGAKTYGVGLVRALQEDKVLVCYDKVDWKQAIHIASQPLLNDQSIEHRYIEHMIASNESLGPYMFITNSVVLAHSKVEHGVNHLGVSFALFKQPIYFPENKVARIILVLAAEDQSKHIHILKDIMTIFKQQQNIDELNVCKSTQQIHTVINEIIEREEQQHENE